MLNDAFKSISLLYFSNTKDETEKSDLYEHLADSEAHHDAQTMDAATEDQMKEKESVPVAGEEGDEELEDGDEEKMKVEEEKKEEVCDL